jgi:hypothetical protein
VSEEWPLIVKSLGSSDFFAAVSSSRLHLKATALITSTSLQLTHWFFDSSCHRTQLPVINRKLHHVVPKITISYSLPC